MSKEYIDRSATVDALNKLCDRVCQYSKAQRKVMCGACPLGDAFTVIEDDLPAADVVEVRTGHWEEVEIEDSEDVGVPPSLVTMRCNKCNRYHTTIFFYGNPTDGMNYCPRCGARMDGGADDGGNP